MLSGPQRIQLQAIARQSIEHGLRTGGPLQLPAGEPDSPLSQWRGCFVTLRIDERLRGCVGTLRARAELGSEVARSAYAAAFSDPRFPPVQAAEVEALEIKISVLSQPQPLPVASRDALLARLRPGVDGVILREGDRVGTFLPEVWESLPEPDRFVDELMRKAGIAQWSPRIEVEIYTTESV